MNRLRKIWISVSDLGVVPSNGMQLNKRIRIFNQASLFLFVAHFFGAISDYSDHLYFTSGLSLIVALYMLVGPLLSKAGLHSFALNSSLIIVCLGIFVSDAYLGKNTLNYIYFFPAIITTPFLSDFEHKNLFYFHVSIPVGLLFLSIATNHSLFLSADIDPAQLEVNQINNIFICSLVTIALVYMIRNSNYKADQHILMEKNILDQIFKNSADALFLVNFNTGLIEECNAMAIHYFETDKANLVGYSIHTLKKDSLNLENHVVINNGLAESVENNVEVLYQTKKGNTFWGNLAITYFKLDENLYMIARIANIDQQKKNEQMVENAAKEKGQFMSFIGHEIRTPLNAVIGMSYLLLQDQPTDSQKEKLDILKFSAIHLLGLLNNVIDFDKIENNKIEIENEDVDLGNLLSNIKNLNLQAAENQHTAIELLIDDQLPKWVKGDAIRLGQIFNNLVSNAIKFTPNGRVIIQIQVQELKEDQVQIQCSVADNGIGIALDKQIQIFEIYNQAETDTTRKYGGTGLGLAITKKLLELMGSPIALKSALGHGATFSFSLSFEISKNPSELEKVIDYAILKDKKALLVDDSIFNLMVARRFLENSGIFVETAENGIVALEKAQNNTYDFILMDLQMPELDGYDASKKIRLFNNWTPIIALSALTTGEQNKKLLEHGIDGYISKPFDPEVFKSKIASVLEFKKSPQT